MDELLKKCQDLSRDTGFCTLARIAFCAHSPNKHTINGSPIHHERFQHVDNRFQQVDDRFQRLEAMVMYSRATSTWHDITPIGVLNPLAGPGGRQQMPPNFPDKVAKFWHLQRPRNHKSRC
jgi:hypothetical protein